MDHREVSCIVLSLYLVLITACCVQQCVAPQSTRTKYTGELVVDASSGRPIPDTLFGLFFEEINHAGAGGLWAELVSNRGFEAGGPSTPSNIDPWSIIGDESLLLVSTDRSSCFDRNKVALRLEVLCDSEGPHTCPAGGVGVYNPGYWGMNIEKGKTYKVVLYVRSMGPIDLSVSFAGSKGLILATANIVSFDVSSWTKAEVLLEAEGTDPKARLQLTTTKNGVVWFDQVSAMPLDTYMGHGFRNDLSQMLADLKPRFLRFPEGDWLRNAVRWKETVGPWEERPGHFGDVWLYWTDDGLGYYEFLQLSEDLGAAPVWVFNNGMSLRDEVDPSMITPFIEEALDGIEFARGDPTSRWGSVRAAMGHPEPFDLKYVAIGNEECGKRNYRVNYLKFYYAIKKAYPDIKIISNCDGSNRPLNHPADFYDFHVYTSAKNLFSLANHFDRKARRGPKAFVSEYAVTGKDAGTGSLLAALGEAAFLLGLEKNSDLVEMASYAPLFVNVHDRRWNPDAIVFDSAYLYGTPSYWMQHFFAESSGAILHNATLRTTSSTSLIATAISWKSSDGNEYLRLKFVNFESSNANVKISVVGLGPNSIQSSGSFKTILTSGNVMDENSFTNPKKVTPSRMALGKADKDMDVSLPPHSITSLDLLKEWSVMRKEETDSFSSISSMVSYERDTKIINAASFTVEREDHTIGNIVRMQLHRDDNVLFAGYKLPHPLQYKIIVRIHTTSQSSPMQAYNQAINDLDKELDHLKSEFEGKNSDDVLYTSAELAKQPTTTSGRDY
ncbi:hypothetical protein ACFE04_030056 [Oxalis oulophora]